jgi:hypothetical protein
MTPEEHNKYLAYSHFGYAAFQLLMTLVMIFFSFMIFGGLAAGDVSSEFPVVPVAAILIVAFIFQLLFTVPSVIAGFGLLKRRRWAKTVGIIAAVLCAMSFPIGIAVCVYTLWFLLGPEGKDFYAQPLSETVSRPVSFLNEPSGANEAGVRWQKREREYVPPKEMPNWRD